jgi:RNA polymerase sigma-70 factor (ECF subfamily)
MTQHEFVNKVLPIKDKLFRLARRILNETDAEDIVQDVFYRLWVKKGDLGKYRSLEAFAMVVTRNLSLDRIKLKSYRNESLGEWNEPMVAENPERKTELKNDVDMVHQVMKSLPEQQRSILHMRDIEEMEFEEIGEVMNMNLNAVRVNLSRARKTVRDQIKKMHDYEYNRNKNIAG